MADTKCHLVQLPTELRLQIYQHLIPTNRTINFRGGANRLSRRMNELETSKPEDSRGYFVVPAQRELEICLSLFYANRMVYNELMDILYGENKFVFHLGEMLIENRHFRTYSTTWGNPFGLAFGGGVSAVRWLKQCDIVVHFSYGDKMDDKLRRYMDGFATAFLDAQYPCRLRKLSVLFSGSTMGRLIGKGHYMLEPLARLRGLESVVIDTMDESFSRKLQSVMMGGKERELRLLEYGKQVYKRKKVKGGKMTVTRSMRKYYDPIFDWSWELGHRDTTATGTKRKALGDGRELVAAEEGTDNDFHFRKSFINFAFCLALTSIRLFKDSLAAITVSLT
jgi:hypothetical protein